VTTQLHELSKTTGVTDSQTCMVLGCFWLTSYLLICHIADS